MYYSLNIYLLTSTARDEVKRNEMFVNFLAVAAVFYPYAVIATGKLGAYICSLLRIKDY